LESTSAQSERCHARQVSILHLFVKLRLEVILASYMDAESIPQLNIDNRECILSKPYDAISKFAQLRLQQREKKAIHRPDLGCYFMRISHRWLRMVALEK